MKNMILILLVMFSLQACKGDSSSSSSDTSNGSTTTSQPTATTYKGSCPVPFDAIQCWEWETTSWDMDQAMGNSCANYQKDKACSTTGALGTCTLVTASGETTKIELYNMILTATQAKGHCEAKSATWAAF